MPLTRNLPLPLTRSERAILLKSAARVQELVECISREANTANSEFGILGVGLVVDLVETLGHIVLAVNWRVGTLINSPLAEMKSFLLNGQAHQHANITTSEATTCPQRKKDPFEWRLKTLNRARTEIRERLVLPTDQLLVGCVACELLAHVLNVLTTEFASCATPQNPPTADPLFATSLHCCQNA